MPTSSRPHPDLSAEPPPLAPGMAQFLAALGTVADHLPAQPSLADIRRMAVQVRLPWNEGGPQDPERRDTRIEAAGIDIVLRSYTPPGAMDSAVFFYLHGGGWSLLNLDTHDRLLREYAAATGVTVVGIDYPLAPETRFPAVIDATATAIRRVSEAGIHGVMKPPARHAIGGDSSGANIAVAVALEHRNRRIALPDALILNYGVYDCDPTRPSYAAFGEAPYQLTPGKMEGFWSNYCARAQDRSAPLASPLRADLDGLCPCYLVVAGQDILRDENLAFAEALRTAGVATQVDIVADAPHAFLEAFQFSDIPAETIRRTAAWLRPVLAA